MPISKYNRYFTKDKTDAKGAAQKTLANLIKEYGPTKGKKIFYAMINQKKGAHKTALQKRAKG